MSTVELLKAQAKAEAEAFKVNDFRKFDDFSADTEIWMSSFEDNECYSDYSPLVFSNSLQNPQMTSSHGSIVSESPFYCLFQQTYMERCCWTW